MCRLVTGSAVTVSRAARLKLRLSSERARRNRRASEPPRERRGSWRRWSRARQAPANPQRSRPGCRSPLPRRPRGATTACSVTSYPVAIAIPRTAPKTALGPGRGIARSRRPIPMSAPRTSPTINPSQPSARSVCRPRRLESPPYFFAPVFSSCISHRYATPVAPEWATETSATAGTGGLPCPISLPLTHHADPRGGNRARLNHSLHGHFVRLTGRSARRVRDEENVVAVGQTVDHRICQADLRPERRKDELPTPGLFHRLDDATVLPSVERCTIDRLLRGEHVLQTFDEVAPALLGYRGEDSGHVEPLRGPSPNRPHCSRPWLARDCGGLRIGMVDGQSAQARSSPESGAPQDRSFSRTMTWFITLFLPIDGQTARRAAQNIPFGLARRDIWPSMGAEFFGSPTELQRVPMLDRPTSVSTL